MKKRVLLSTVFVGLITLLVSISFHSGQSPALDDRVTAARKNGADFREIIDYSREEELIEAAQARHHYMAALIKSNPEQAIAEALSWSEWNALPEEAKALVETPFSVVANVDVLIECGEDSRMFIETDFPGIGKMDTYIFGRRSEVDTKNNIPIQGIRVGKVGALREAVFQPLERDDEVAVLGLFPVAVEKQSAVAVASLAGGRIFYFPDLGSLNEANSKLADLESLPGMDSSGHALFAQVEPYLLEEGAIDFQTLEHEAIASAEAWTGTPREMYVILVDFPDRKGQPVDPVDFSNRCNDVISERIWEMSYEQTHIVCSVDPATYEMPENNGAYTNSSLLYTHAVAAAGINEYDYDTVCVVHPDIDGESYGGLASVGGRRMWLYSTGNDTVIHELGHNYGSRHASYWVSGSSDPVDPTGAISEYGDFTDVMGSGDSPEGHFNHWHKKRIGWLSTNNWMTVTNSGRHRIHRLDHKDTTADLRALEVPKLGNGSYWIGYRQEYASNETFGRGAYLVWKRDGHNRSCLVDTTPESADGKYDAGVALGKTYSDPAAAVHITPTARGGQTPNEWLDVVVNLGAFPGNSAPTASISGATNLGLNVSSIFTVTALDADGDELAYYWDIGDGLVKPNTPSIPVAFVSGGTTTVSCVVSDMKGGTNMVSLSVVISSSLDNWTQRTSGITRDLEEIAVGNGRAVIVADDETTLYSDDGSNWTSHQSFTFTPYNNIFFEAVAYDGSQFIACGMDYDFGQPGWEQTVYTSSDGTSWTERYDSNSASPGNIRLLDIAYGDGNYVAVGNAGTIVRSTDGISWSPVASGTSTDLQSVAFGDGTFVIAGDAGGGTSHVILTSTNGLSWTDYSTGSDISANQWMFKVEYVNDRFLAGGGFRSGIQHSTDQGEQFTVGADDDYEMDGFAYGSGLYFATGVFVAPDRNTDVNLVSVNGVTWTELPTVQKDNQNAAVYFNGTMITVGDNGSIWQSDTVEAPSSGYANWQLENAVALGLDRDPQDDADADGVNNLREYALGSSATDSGSVPEEGIFSLDGEYFQASFGRERVRDDVDYAVERSVALVTDEWNDAETIIVEDTESNLTARSAYPIATQTNEFLRLHIELK